MKINKKRIKVPLLCVITLLFALTLLIFFDQNKINATGEIIAYTDTAGGMLEYLQS